jgi:poly(A) polymerase
MADPNVLGLFAALNQAGEARIVGGAVRDALMRRPVGDLDFATTLLPDQTIGAVEAAGFKAVPTGYAHGTITAVKDGRGYEITTLRKDVATDGRRADVAFGTDWETDALRRDFTINALSVDAQGTIYDYCDGLADIETRAVRFIGNAETRIREDYLRTLRFYRFFAHLGSGRPDADGIRATAKLKDGLSKLSAERVWQEIKKLLTAPDPSRALLWMRQAGVLTAVLPESERWGIDAIPALISSEQALKWTHDTLLRLMAITPPDLQQREALAERLRLSKSERERLLAHAATAPINAETSDLALRKRLYREGLSGIADHLKLALVSMRSKAEADNQTMIDIAKLSGLLNTATTYDRPEFPVGGNDIKSKNLEGPALGKALEALEQQWIDSGFTLTKAQLLSTSSG